MHISIIQLSACDVTWRNVFGDVGGTGRQVGECTRMV